MSAVFATFSVLTAVPAALSGNEWRYGLGVCSATWSILSIIVARI